jgi:mannitol-specific phosphotransferase system IIBC component
MRRLPIVAVMAMVLSFVVAAALLGCEANTQRSASNQSKADANSETSKEEAKKIESAMSAAPMARRVSPTGKPPPATIPSVLMRCG